MRKKIFVFIIFIIITSCLLSCTIISEHEAGIDVAKKNLSSVLELTCRFQASMSYATGFIIDEYGFVLTNAHVVTEKVEGFIYDTIEIKGKFHNSNKEYNLHLIDYNVEKDIALLKFDNNDLIFKPVTVGSSTNLSYGATIFALGNAEGKRISMTKGIISVPNVRLKENDSSLINEYIQIDAAINNGSSGGPVMNIEGNVIGMISFKIKKPDTFTEGMGFAIPAHVFMEYIRANTDNIEEDLENQAQEREEEQDLSLLIN